MASKPIKSTVWDIYARSKILYKGVQFEEPMTKEQAIEAFTYGEYIDISDEELMDVEEVIDEGHEKPRPYDEDEDENGDEYDEYNLIDDE